jgi:hypothetical protein
VDSTKAKWVNLLKRAEKWMLLAKKMKAAENNLQKNRLSIGSLFFYLILLSCFTAVSKSETLHQF